MRNLIFSFIILSLISSSLKAEKLKIGFMTTLSGPASSIGAQMKNAVNLAVDKLNGKIDSYDVEVIFVDDQRKPDLAKQLANRLIKKEKVDIVAGIIWSNVLMAIHKTVTKNNVLLISSNAGPSLVAGKLCNKNFFSLSWQNDQTPEAMGKYMNDKGINEVYLIAPNYQAGKDMLNGFKRYYKGKISGEVYTKLGQSDFQAELSALKVKNPPATFIFQPGGMGINFIKQWKQSDMDRYSKLYTAFVLDAISLPALKKNALGILGTQTWSQDINNPINNEFVSNYKKKYDTYPSFYAAQAYDTILAIEQAVKDSKSKNIANIRNSLNKNQINTTRGKISMNSNQFPIQNIYLRKVILDQDGVYTTKIVETVFENHRDFFAKDCSL